MVPFDDQSPFVTSGMRIATAAMTTRGISEEDCLTIVNWIDRILTHHTSEKVIAEVKAEVNEFASNFRLYPEVKVASSKSEV